MKKILITALLMVGMTAFAQEKETPKPEKLTLEQRNELQLKQLTLDLDLTTSQQNEMKKIITEQSAKKEKALAERKATENKNLTSDERFAKRSQLLDEQIALKQSVKKILNAEQYSKWENSLKKKRAKMKDGLKRHEKHNAKP